MKKLLSLVIPFLLLISCTSTERKITLPSSNASSMNQVLVVMDNDLWQGIEGDELRKVTGEEVLGLPQREPQFRVTQIPVNAFKNLFKLHRNILIVAIGKETGFNVKTNRYASPQTMITLVANNKESLISLIQQKKLEITRVFKNAEIKALQRKLRRKQFDTSTLKTLENLGVSLEIPINYKLVDDTGDFLWMRKYIKQGQTMNLIVYELPITSTEDTEGKNIVSVRDTIGKKYIPGQFEDTYLITEQAYSPHTFLVELNGKKTFETRGKWEVKGDFMAGPFLNYTVVDKVNNRLVVVEGFTYAPTTNKRDFMFELEAILKTVKIKN
ncbi:MAG: DUF4837 domain-containing protein [Lutibacter sp.]|nr:MAG: DUF4837 domain-containing protein [Lutibacter sp.]